ncbi:hypothetical protein ACFXG1_32935 [Streptomyces sp. NPDC059248]|uniref:hypothetical protein n=1 Tax=Streptomyces sp. NPDC059248 TaxID=3346791 RepID=UPI003699256F
MQNSELPDLAHTRTRPLHWAATATATAAVVALAGLLQPGNATATATSDAKTGAGPVSAAPDPATVRLPLECGTAAYTVTRKAVGDLDGDGGPETIVAGRCAAGSGTPPEGIYVLARTRDGGPRVVATLVAPADRLTVGALAVTGRAVTATLYGYSSPEVPVCCPDEKERVSWRWEGGKFLRTPGDTGSGTAGTDTAAL